MLLNQRKALMGLILVFGMVLAGCNLPGSNPGINTQPPPTAASATQAGSPSTPESAPALAAKFNGPQMGAPMAWVDGSVLVFIPQANGADNAGQKGFWITLDPITNYQFSLCVQAGLCQPPGEAQAASEYADPAKESLMVGAVGPDQASSYCGWISGRAPTKEEQASLGQITKAFFTGGMSPADFFALGFHCIVEHPAPRPGFTRSSAYYDPAQPMTNMRAVVTGSRTFCQEQVPYQSLDLKLGGNENDAVLHSVTGLGGANCQQVAGSNRVVCFGGGGPNAQAQVGLLCDSFTGLKCQTGFELDASGCGSHLSTGVLAGEDDWEYGSKAGLSKSSAAIGDDWERGVPSPLKPIQLPGGAMAGAAFINHTIVLGVMVAQRLEPQPGPCYADATSTPGLTPLPVDTTPGPGDYGYLPIEYYECLHHLGPFARNNSNPVDANIGWHPIPVICPVGYYFDANIQSCVSLGAPQTGCPDGYTWNSASLGCEAAQTAKNYPGCPAGQVLEPLSGICDAASQILAPDKLLQTTLIALDLPVCAVPTKEKKYTGGSTCPAGQTYVCSGIKVQICACK